MRTFITPMTSASVVLARYREAAPECGIPQHDAVGVGVVEYLVLADIVRDGRVDGRAPEAEELLAGDEEVVVDVEYLYF